MHKLQFAYPLAAHSAFSRSVSLSADVPSRSFWSGVDPHSSELSTGSVTVHKPPTGPSNGNDHEERTGGLEEASYRTNPQDQIPPNT